MFLQNDVIEYTDAPPRAFRILWIDQDKQLVYTFELDLPSASPQPIPLQALALDLRMRRARLLLTDRWRVTPGADIAQQHRELQEKAWHAVRTLHQHVPDLYERRWRARAVADYASLHGMSPANIMRYLRRYWERGQTLEALLPDYANSGAPGRARVASAGVKRGRPSKAAASPNVDASLRAIFRATAARHAATHPDFSRRAAYRQMLADHFADAAPDATPSYGQFIYWLERDREAGEDPDRRLL
jgi:hypothetical protein